MGCIMKYITITYGCQMNWSDSERIAAVLEDAGCKKTLNMNEADLIVVNMCSVRQSAVDRVFGMAEKLKTLKINGKKAKTILTGCVLPADKKTFSERFDLILDINDMPKLPKILKISASKTPRKHYLKIKPEYTSPFSGSIPIMTGCNNFCSYCVVPHTRGREISRPTKDIVCEAENLVKRGYKEIWLLGQNVNSYKDKEINFPKLLKRINDIPGNFWIRFTSSHPKDFSDELINAMRECEKVTEYLNLPVQAGDNKVLKAMNRPYSIEEYKKIVKKVRKEIPDIALSTDIIVGFPGETKTQFENSVRLFKEMKFDMGYILKYSPRKGSAAEKLKDNVSKEEKVRREKILTDILRQTALENNKKYIGKEIDVLVEKGKSDNLWLAKTRTNKTVQFRFGNNLIGKFAKVKITGALPWGLGGKLYEK